MVIDRRERIDVLDGLRGGLAISVMVYHLFRWLYDIELIALGSYSVYTFFVLSGFAMAWVYGQRAEDFPVRAYCVARMGRILPLWWLAIAATVLSGLPATPGVSKLLENLTLLSALTPTGDIALGGWTIEIEVVFYLLFPALLAVARSTKALVGTFVMALAIRWFYVPTTFENGEQLPAAVTYFQIPTFLAFFLGGMIVARIRSESTVRSGVVFGVAGLGLVVAMLSLNGLSPRVLFAGPVSIALTVASVVAVGLLSYVRNSTRPMVVTALGVLGSISYAVYLLHPIVFAGVNRLGLPAPAALTATVVISVVVAWCSYTYFERPLAAWARVRFR